MSPTQKPRGIAVIDVGFTNSKVILYDSNLRQLAEHKIISPHHKGKDYLEIDVGHISAFAANALCELDQVLPIDSIVSSSHGACVVCVDQHGDITVPVMDYMSEPPPHIVYAYHQIMPDYAEVFTPPLPMALLHGMQLFWQQHIMPDAFSRTTKILPLTQYVALALGGRRVVEISCMSCQSHLMDLRTNTPSSLARKLGWDKFFAPMAKAWQVIGHFKPTNAEVQFHGRGEILAGVHDSSANFLRYLAAGQQHFSLLSTGTWVIGFDTDADVTALDAKRDIVANKSIFGNTIACCRFFGGKEFEILAGAAAQATPSLQHVQALIENNTLALPSFTDSGGPMPGTGGKGQIFGPAIASPEAQASLAILYCALMVSESLDAISSKGDIIVDGPFSQNEVFLSVLAGLRASQKILASAVRDGTAAGAACLALMPDGILPNIPVALRQILPAKLNGLKPYQMLWQSLSRSDP